MVEKVKRFLLYAGFNKEEYENVRSEVLQANLGAVALVVSCADFLILAMFIATFYVSGIKSNRIVYLWGMIISSLITIVIYYYAREKNWIITPLVYASYIAFYGYGIMIGTVTDPDHKTVTFIAMLVFLPVLFIERPINTIISTLISVTLFVTLCFKVKTDWLLQNDVINAIIFGVIGIVSGITVDRIRIHSYILEDKLREIGRLDQLTKMNNRSFYELNLEIIPELPENALACIYIDVNGLHELNNEHGHETGDEMLKFVAERIKETLGEELSFRIGGDEFVAFVPDINHLELRDKLKKMVKDIEDAGYHVAIGFEIMRAGSFSISDLINSAEEKMRKNKERYYKNRAHDRRRR